MVLFNYSTRELTAKIVYYGPGLCGKTTNLQYIYDSLPENIKKGKMLSLATKTDRTLFFDFLPIDLGKIRGMKTRVQLYTVPGQVFYNSTRKLVLKGADGVVFVADSQSKMLEANVESYKNLEDNLREMGLSLEELPVVMQFNKRDLPNLAAVEEMNTQINRHNAPFYEAVATTGIGVEDTLKAITKRVLNNLAQKYKLEGAPVASETQAAPGEGPAPREPAAPRPGPRPVAAPPVAAAARPAPRAAAPPPAARASVEDMALDALELEEPDLGPPPPVAARPARQREAPATRPPVRAAAGRPAPPGPTGDDVFDLGDELGLENDEGKADEGTVDLGEELLEELDEESPVAARAPASRGPIGRAIPPPASPRGLASAPRFTGSAPLDLEEPIDLGEGWDATPEPPGAQGAPIDIGVLTPGQEKTVDLPVSASVNGRQVRLSLRVTLRLSR
jgi:hypothetical protein